MSTTNAAPSTLGKYQIRGVLGRGAMGTVYDGWDPAIGRRVAIKTVRMLDNDDAEAVEGLARFKNEAQAAGRLTHPNIVGVYDYGESDETAYIVMEFVEGQSLKERLDAKDRFPVSETVWIMEQVLAGLQFSHGKGVIHRDVKPGNVMMTRDGQVKLADFGIARIESSVMTQAGTILGTPAYMSPEQLMAQAVDARSDIYSSGVLLYQLLTGERPFEGGLTAVIHKALNTTPPRPSEISVTAPASLDAVVARAMARRPDERYPNAASFARAMREALETPQTGLAGLGLGSDDEATMVAPPQRPVAKPAVLPSPPSSKKAGGLSPALLGVAAVGVLALVGGGAWFALRPATPEPGPAATASSAAPPPAAPPPAARAAAPEPEAATPVPPGPPAETQATNTAPEPPPPPNPQSDRPAPTTAPAPINVPALRATLASVALSARCALPRVAVSEEGAVSVSGPVGTGAPEVALREAVQAAAPAAPVAWDARGVDGPYCDVLDVVHLVAQPTSPFLGLALKDDASRLKAHDSVLPVLKLPEFPAYLLVDYISHDGSVAHLFPIRGVPNTAFSANATVRLGTSAKDRVEVGPPFGTDVIVATASSVPLFAAGIVRQDESLQTYLPALKAAIEAAQRRNAKLTARALVLDTVER
ncbi:MAG: eukaryotic-like serine/threonine-protein kinase [Acetobacteraceae bacterium]|nr:eukaryotic-like serine/threonine-protein kinase [Acetobacteraceae bacterium]